MFHQQTPLLLKAPPTGTCRGPLFPPLQLQLPRLAPPSLTKLVLHPVTTRPLQPCLSQSCSDDVSTVASSGPSQSPSQANASVNQSGHTVLVGLIVALALVGGLLVTLIVCLILLYLRRIRHHRTSRPLIHPVPSVKEAALSLPGVAGGSTRMASPSVPLSTAVDAGDSGNDSASASAEGSYAQDTNRCESACPLDSQSDTRPGWTYPSSKIGLAL